MNENNNNTAPDIITPTKLLKQPFVSSKGL